MGMVTANYGNYGNHYDNHLYLSKRELGDEKQNGNDHRHDWPVQHLLETHLPTTKHSHLTLLQKKD